MLLCLGRCVTGESVCICKPSMYNKKKGIFMQTILTSLTNGDGKQLDDRTSNVLYV